MNNLSERTARKSSTSGIYHTRAHTPMYIIQFWDFLRWKSALSTLIKSVLGSLVYVYIMVCVCALSAHRQIIVHVSRAFLIWGRREIIFNFDAYQRTNSQLCTHNNDNHLRCCFNAHIMTRCCKKVRAVCGRIRSAPRLQSGTSLWKIIIFGSVLCLAPDLRALRLDKVTVSGPWVAIYKEGVGRVSVPSSLPQCRWIWYIWLFYSCAVKWSDARGGVENKSGNDN